MIKCGHHIITDGCKHCRNLQDKWYGKISKDFEEAESLNYQDRPLKVWHNTAFKSVSILEIEITHDYYEKASELLHSYAFEDDMVKRIWELYCEGKSSGKIEIEINKFYKERQIRNIISRLEREIEW